MIKKRKTILWLIVSLFIAVTTIRVIFLQNRSLSLKNLSLIIWSASPSWIVVSLLLVLGFIVFEGFSLQYILNRLGYTAGPIQGIIYSAGDQFFSAITPSASGGQPASAFFMYSDHIPGAAITVCLLINLVMYVASTLTIGVICLLINPDILSAFGTASKCLIVFGILATVLLTVTFTVLLKKPEIIQKCGEKLLHFMSGRRYLKDASSLSDRFKGYYDDYSLCSGVLNSGIKSFIPVFILDLGQRIVQITIAVTLHLAIGGPTRTNLLDLWTIQALSLIGANFIPVPGGMGVADYLMIDGFKYLFDTDYAYSFQTICRSFSFYLGTMISGLIVLYGSVKVTRERRRKTNVYMGIPEKSRVCGGNRAKQPTARRKNDGAGRFYIGENNN